jgi:ADP-heptose:LPS heptosyltransferase
MTLPALEALRKLAPDAEIELGVGRWNEELARGLPFVDRLRIVNAPWAAWGAEASWSTAARAVKEGVNPDLVIDFQGDVRVILLMALTRAPLRAGFGETGGAHLLTHRGVWDESRSWYRQCMDLLAALYPEEPLSQTIVPYNYLTEEDRHKGRELLAQAGLSEAARPWIGVHPSAGRAIKEWATDRFAAFIDRLVEATSGTVVLTGGPSDRDLVEQVGSKTKAPTLRLVGSAGLRDFSAFIEKLDLFVTGDTGPMHISNAVGTPNLAIFGPSDPVRYGPENDEGLRAVVREPLDCSPCNMIRNPPFECTEANAPECLERLTVDRVLQAALRLLEKRARV